MVEVGTHQCHHLHPLTDLAGSTLSDHFRDVNNGEKKNHSRLVHLRWKSNILTSTYPTTSIVCTNWLENGEQHPADLEWPFPGCKCWWLVGWRANGGHERSHWQLVNQGLGPTSTSGVLQWTLPRLRSASHAAADMEVVKMLNHRKTCPKYHHCWFEPTKELRAPVVKDCLRWLFLHF